MTREELKEILKESLSIRIIECGNLSKTIKVELLFDDEKITDDFFVFED